MHIGVMRYSQNFELDFINASSTSSGTELRLGIVEALLQLGHKITILSPFPKKQMNILDGIGEHFNYTIFKKLIYSPEGVPKDLDLLFIESAVGNIYYGRKNIERLIDIFNKYSGKVVYYHHADQLSCLPLGAMMDGERTNFEETEKISFKNVFKGVNIDDKQFILLTHAVPRLIIKRQDTNRFRYSRFDHSIQIPIGYSPEFDRVRRFISIRKRDYDLIYIGKQKSNVRVKRIVDLYGSGECCTRTLHGEWKDLPNNFRFRGIVPGHGNLYKRNVYGRAKASIATADGWFTDVGMITTRLVQAPRSGNLALVDGNYVGAATALGPDFVVNDHRDVHKWIDGSARAIMDGVYEQLEYLDPWIKIMENTIYKIRRMS